MHLFIFLFSFLSFTAPNHAFYVSVMDISYEESAGEIVVQIKIFTDDLEDDIRASQEKLVKLQDGVSPEEALIVHRYLLSKVELLIDKSPAPLSLSSCKQEGDAVFTSYHGKLAHPPQSLQVRNSLLIDLFPTQSNIIRLKGKAAQGLLKLNKQKQEGELSF